MERLVVYQDIDKNTTQINNRFIDEFMEEADGDAIKVYLYLLRVMSVGICTSVTDMSERFGIPESSVIKALKYWEFRGLLAVDYNIYDRPVRVALVDLRMVPEASRSVENSETMLHASETGSVINNDIKSVKNANTDYVSDGHKLQNKVCEKKELKDINSDDTNSEEDNKRLVFIAEQYLKRSLLHKEIEVLFYLHYNAKMSEDMIDYLLQYCVSKGKFDFRYIEKVGLSWAEKGYGTPQDISSDDKKYDNYTYEILKALGRSGNPTEVEAEYTKKWKEEFGFGMDIVLEACKRTVMAVENHRIAYCDKILSAWYNNGVKQFSDISSLDLEYAKKANSSYSNKWKNPKPQSKNQFNNFEKTKYDISKLEAVLVSNN